MRHPVAAKEQRVLPLTHQRADETLRNGIVDAVATVFQVSEYLIPEAPSDLPEEDAPQKSAHSEVA